MKKTILYKEEIDMLNTSQGLVIISDRVENREGINIFSNNLEFSSPTVFNALKEAAEN